MHAVFVLIFCMGMVLRERVQSVYRQVELHAAELAILMLLVACALHVP